MRRISSAENSCVSCADNFLCGEFPVLRISGVEKFPVRRISCAEKNYLCGEELPVRRRITCAEKNYLC